jgi:colicin import membrane protein
VTGNWNRPDSASSGLRCVLRIVQIPGGDVISAHVSAPCNADQATRNSIEQAVLKAAPLPYRGYEKVFQRDIDFNFRYDG